MKNNAGSFGDWKIHGKLEHPLHTKEKKVSFCLPWARETCKRIVPLWRLLFSSSVLPRLNEAWISSRCLRSASQLPWKLPCLYLCTFLAARSQPFCPLVILHAFSADLPPFFWQPPYFAPVPSFPSTSVFRFLSEPPSLAPPLGREEWELCSTPPACSLSCCLPPPPPSLWVSGTESFWGFLSGPFPPWKQ